MEVLAVVAGGLRGHPAGELGNKSELPHADRHDDPRRVDGASVGERQLERAPLTPEALNENSVDFRNAVLMEPLRVLEKEGQRYRLGRTGPRCPAQLLEAGNRFR